MVILDLCLRKTRAGKLHDYRYCFRKAPNIENVFSLHLNAKQAFLNSSAFKIVSEKLHFRDELLWTVGLTLKTVEITKAVFSNFSVAALVEALRKYRRLTTMRTSPNKRINYQNDIDLYVHHALL